MTDTPLLLQTPGYDDLINDKNETFDNNYLSWQGKSHKNRLLLLDKQMIEINTKLIELYDAMNDKEYRLNKIESRPLAVNPEQVSGGWLDNMFKVTNERIDTIDNRLDALNRLINPVTCEISGAIINPHLKNTDENLQQTIKDLCQMNDELKKENKGLRREYSKVQTLLSAFTVPTGENMRRSIKPIQIYSS